MKVKLAIAIILASLALVAAAETSASSKVGYTCKYRYASASTSIVIDGSDNSRAFCRAFNSGARAQRFYGPTRGLFVCRLESRHYSLRISVYARSKAVGSLFCVMMKNSAGKEFVRTR